MAVMSVLRTNAEYNTGDGEMASPNTPIRGEKQEMTGATRDCADIAGPVNAESRLKPGRNAPLSW